MPYRGRRGRLRYGSFLFEAARHGGLGGGLEPAVPVEHLHEGLGVRGLGQALHRCLVFQKVGRLGCAENAAGRLLLFHDGIPSMIL